MIYFNRKNQVIVIGSGVAGLSTAVSLAKTGKQVKVLEKKSFPGNSLKSFKENKWSFNSGYHYLSSMNGDNNTLFKNLTGDRLSFSNSESVYEKVIFKDGSTYDILSDRERFLSRLKNDFPCEIIGLVSFYREIEHVIEHNRLLLNPRRQSGLFRLLSGLKSNYKFKHIKNMSLDDLLNKYFSNYKLKIILSLHCGKLLTPPNETPFRYYSLFKSSFFDGEAFVKGNTESIIEALVEELKDYGGEIEYNTEVTAIKSKKNKVKCIELANGEIISCRSVISSIGISRTYENFVEDFKNSKRYNTLNSNISSVRSYIRMNIGFNCNLNEMGIDRYSFRVLSKDPFEFDNNPKNNNYSPNHTIITFSKDSEPATSQVFIPTNCKYFTESEEYTKLKEDLTNTILDIFEKQFPGISKNIEYTNLSIPFANEEFCFASVKSEKIRDQLFHPASEISGLYFTGEDILTHGITGACIGGIITASNVAKKNLIKVFE